MKALIGAEGKASGRLYRAEVLEDGEVCALETDFEGGAVLAARALAFRRAGEAPARGLGDYRASRARWISGSAEVVNHLVLRAQGNESTENHGEGKQTSCDHENSPEPAFRWTWWRMWPRGTEGKGWDADAMTKRCT